MRFSPQTYSSSLHAAITLAGLGLTALAAAPAHAQGLNGQSVDVSLRIGTTAPTSTAFSNDVTKTVTPAGATFQNVGSTAFSTIITPTRIQFTNPNAFSITLTPSTAGFLGFAASEIGPSPATITGFSINPATNLVGFDSSRVTSDSTDIFANFVGLTFQSGQNVTLDLAFAPVPEASTTVSFCLLLALGTGGLVIAAKRKKAAPSL